MLGEWLGKNLLKGIGDTSEGQPPLHPRIVFLERLPFFRAITPRITRLRYSPMNYVSRSYTTNMVFMEAKCREEPSLKKFHSDKPRKITSTA